MTISKPNREIPFDNYVAWAKQEIERDIMSRPAEYIMNVNEEAFIEMLTTSYSVHFKVYYNTERLELEGQQQKRKVFHDTWGYEDIKVFTEYHFCLKYKFTGDIVVLQIEPRCFHYSTLYKPTPIVVVGDELLIRFIATEANTKKIQNLIDETKGNHVHPYISGHTLSLQKKSRCTTAQGCDSYITVVASNAKGSSSVLYIHCDVHAKSDTCSSSTVVESVS